LQDSFLTIAHKRQTELKVKRSRFIATAIPISTRDLAESEYQSLQKHFHDATHNCFAYQTGLGAELSFRYSDDGEPSGTAGKPIYDTILSHEITNVLLVVTRYYGGIKLGTGGLARAYRDSASQVLSESEIIERLILQSFRIIFEHEQTSVVMKTISDFEIVPQGTSYDDRVSMECAIRLSRYEPLCRELVERSRGKISIEKI
jgi:uncharacterized YigZ family protein